MKTSRIFVLAGVAVASMAFVRQDGNVLRLNLAEGTTSVYKVESKLKQTINAPTGEQEIGINTTATYKLNFKKVDAAKGAADIELETIVDKIDADGPMAEMIAGNKPKPVTMKGTLSAAGKLDLVQDQNSAAMMMMGMSQQSGPNPILVQFPDKSVKVGDTWDVVIPKGMFTGKEDQKLTAKLVGDKDLDGKSVWVISTTGKLTSDIDTSKLPKTDNDGPMGGQNVKVHAVSDVTIESLVEKGTGRVLRSETKTKTKSNVEVVDFGLNVESNGNSTTVATLQG